MKEIFLVRHGQTDWNLQRKMQGHTDIPLNQNGIRQATALISIFNSLKPHEIHSSDLSRAYETALILSQDLNIKPKVSQELREVFLGQIEGLTKDQIIEIYGLESWAQWGSNELTHFSFEWPQSESRLKQALRFDQFITEKLKTENEKIVFVTHGLAIRTFLLWKYPEIKTEFPIPNCVVYKIQIQGSVWSSPEIFHPGESAF